MLKIAEEVENLIKEKSPRMNRIYEECGLYRILDSEPAVIYKNFYKVLSLESIACLMTEIFINDERITNIMSTKPELAKTASITKTDLTYIIADALGIGRNKTSTLINQCIDIGAFIIIPNIYDVNAKMIKPAKMSREELHGIYVRICKINNKEVTKEDFEHFMEAI